MSDKDAVRSAQRRWSAVLDLANKPGKSAAESATIIALWATMNVDHLLTIAERNVK